MNRRDALRQIYAERGTLSPAVVVEVASDPEHPLHPEFEWNDAKAGHLYRLNQAHRMIMTVQFSSGPTAPPVREWHAVRRDGTFQPLDEIVADPIAREVLLRQAEREWQALKQRYNHLAEFIAMVQQDVAAA